MHIGPGCLLCKSKSIGGLVSLFLTVGFFIKGYYLFFPAVFSVFTGIEKCINHGGTEKTAEEYKELKTCTLVLVACCANPSRLADWSLFFLPFVFSSPAIISSYLLFSLCSRE